MTEISMLLLFKYFVVLASFVITLIMIKGSAAKKLVFALAVALGMHLLFDHFLLREMWKYWMESQPRSIRISFSR